MPPRPINSSSWHLPRTLPTLNEEGVFMKGRRRSWLALRAPVVYGYIARRSAEVNVAGFQLARRLPCRSASERVLLAESWPNEKAHGACGPVGFQGLVETTRCAT